MDKLMNFIPPFIVGFATCAIMTMIFCVFDMPYFESELVKHKVGRWEASPYGYPVFKFNTTGENK